MKQKEPSFFFMLDKMAFYEQYAREYLPEFLLLEIYTPAVLKAAHERWETLPAYVTQGLEPEITRLIQAGNVTEIDMNRYWIQRAVKVLRGYKSCPVPLSADKRGIGPKRNLLSSMGHKRLHLLEKAVAENDYSDEVAALARPAAQKVKLDLSLFVNFDHLARFDWHEKGNAKDLTVSLSSGCYNRCVHCGYEAAAPVTHMPFPVFLALFQKSVERGNVMIVNPVQRMVYAMYEFYNNSDPIAYRDPIINADVSSVIAALPELLNKETFHLSFLTKGVLTKQDESVFARVLHNLLRWPKGMVVWPELSLIDLPGEPVAKNVERIKRTAHIFRELTGHNPRIRHYHLPETPNITEADLGLPPATDTHYVIDSCTNIDVVGRWADTINQLSPEDQQRALKTTKPKGYFSTNDYIIASDLTLYDVYLEGDRYVWHPLCSVFDKDFMKRFKPKPPKAIHIVTQSTSKIEKGNSLFDRGSRS